MRFRDEYDFLSNMYECNLIATLGGKVYIFSNAEALFQAQKDLSRAEEFASMNGPQAKYAGRRVFIEDIKAWNKSGRLYAMAFAIHTKFKSPILMDKLRAVKSYIAEDNDWGDTFWGVSRGSGKNMLGKMLMVVRETDNSLEALRKFVEGEIKD